MPVPSPRPESDVSGVLRVLIGIAAGVALVVVCWWVAPIAHSLLLEIDWMLAYFFGAPVGFLALMHLCFLDQRARQRDGLRIRSWWLTLAGILAITAVGSTLMLTYFTRLGGPVPGSPTAFLFAAGNSLCTARIPFWLYDRWRRWRQNAHEE